MDEQRRGESDGEKSRSGARSPGFGSSDWENDGTLIILTPLLLY